MGESDLTLGNEPLRFRNVSEDVLASKKPPGGLEDACLRSPKRGVELPGASRGGGGIRIQVGQFPYKSSESNLSFSFIVGVVKRKRSGYRRISRSPGTPETDGDTSVH